LGPMVVLGGGGCFESKFDVQWRRQTDDAEDDDDDPEEQVRGYLKQPAPWGASLIRNSLPMGTSLIRNSLPSRSLTSSGGARRTMKRTRMTIPKSR